MKRWFQLMIIGACVALMSNTGYSQSCSQLPVLSEGFETVGMVGAESSHHPKAEVRFGTMNRITINAQVRGTMDLSKRSNTASPFPRLVAGV